MHVSAEAIEREALALSRADRSRLVVSLLQSVEDRPAAGSHQTAWLAEADRRYQAYLHGEEAAIPVDETFAALRADDQ